MPYAVMLGDDGTVANILSEAIRSKQVESKEVLNTFYGLYNKYKLQGHEFLAAMKPPHGFNDRYDMPVRVVVPLDVSHGLLGADEGWPYEFTYSSKKNILENLGRYEEGKDKVYNLSFHQVPFSKTDVSVSQRNIHPQSFKNLGVKGAKEYPGMVVYVELRLIAGDYENEEVNNARDGLVAAAKSVIEDLASQTLPDRACSYNVDLRMINLYNRDVLEHLKNHNRHYALAYNQRYVYVDYLLHRDNQFFVEARFRSGNIAKVEDLLIPTL